MMRVFDGPPARKHVHQPVTRSKGELISFIILIAYCNVRQCSRLARKRPPSRKTQATSITWQCRYKLLSLLFITGLYTSAKDLAVLPELSDRRLFSFTFPYALTHDKHRYFNASEWRGVLLHIRNGSLMVLIMAGYWRAMHYALYTVLVMPMSLLVNYQPRLPIRCTIIIDTQGAKWLYYIILNVRC